MGLDEACDPGPVRLDGLGELQEWLNPRALDFLDPSCEIGAGSRQIGDLPEVVEQGLQPVGFAQRGVLIHETDQLPPTFVRQKIPVLEEGVLVSLQGDSLLPL